MPPGTVHIVTTLVDSFVEGGHFYSKHSLIKSLEAGIRENKSGAYDVNTEHICAEFILHALVEAYANDIKASDPKGDGELDPLCL